MPMTMDPFEAGDLKPWPDDDFYPTALDFFAAHSLPGLLNARRSSFGEGSSAIELIAETAFGIGDAMLKVRARRAGIAMEPVEQWGFDGLLDTLKELDKRLRECSALGDICSARDAYDSDYQGMVSMAIAVAEGRNAGEPAAARPTKPPATLLEIHRQLVTALQRAQSFVFHAADGGPTSEAQKESATLVLRLVADALYAAHEGRSPT